MPLDPNLPTWDIEVRHGSEGKIVDLRDHTSKEYKYAAYQEDEKFYFCGSSVPWIDPSTEAHLATLAVLPPDKDGKKNIKLVEFLDSPGFVEVKNSAGLRQSWEWSFEFEGNVYSWRREMVSLLGGERGFQLVVRSLDKRFKDDRWPVAMYTPGKQGATVQLLDYNIKRLDPPIDDQKGQEILIFLSLLSFLEYHWTPTSHYFGSKSEAPITSSASLAASGSSSTSHLDPQTQAYLAARQGLNAVTTGLDTLALREDGSKSPKSPNVGTNKGKGREPSPNTLLPPPRLPSRHSRENSSEDLHSMSNSHSSTDPNEIEVKDDGKVEHYLPRAMKLFEDKSLVFITLISRTPNASVTTFKLAEEIKRSWYKAHGEELKTFVPKGEDAPPPPPPPPPPSSVFSLSMSRRKSYVPPPPPLSLKVYISRMDLGLPNYAPKVTPSNPAIRGPDWRPPIIFSSGPPQPPQVQMQPPPPPPVRPVTAPGRPGGGKISKEEEEMRAKVLKKARGGK